MPGCETDAAGLRADLERALAAARAAGEIGLARFRSKVRWRNKTDGTPVTEVDEAIDALLRARLPASIADGWLSEEGTRDPRWQTCARVWVVDPLDGTAGYLRGDPHWCVSIALLIEHAPVLGVIHAPAIGRTWWALAGRGAWLNGAAARVSARARLAGSRVIGPAAVRNAGCWAEPWPRVRLLRYPSLALRLAYVACGEADAMLAPGRKNYWDIAAGHIIVRAAGGRVADAAGEEPRYDEADAKVNGVIAAGEGLFADIERRMKGFRCRPRRGRDSRGKRS